jgi:hypothetical protein
MKSLQISESSLQYIEEPNLLFGNSQKMVDPRDGITLFGPLDENITPYGISYALIGTNKGRNRFKNWLKSIQLPVFNEDSISRPYFPGFEAAYKLKWLPDKLYEINIEDIVIEQNIYTEDPHTRVFNIVSIFTDQIIKVIKDEHFSANIWVVVIPDYIYQYCRPSIVIPSDKIITRRNISNSAGKKFAKEVSFFEDINIASYPYNFEANFHNQIKARLLQYNIATQIIRESTLAPEEYLNNFGKPRRNILGMKGHIAWSISNSIFYKSGGRPWKLGYIREGVCYIGLVFKQDEKSKDERTACCAAQMFLDSGDGTVFKGAVGPWYNPKRGEYHLKRKYAKQLIELALETYKDLNNQKLPRELFIHGKTKFNKEEFCGFKDAVSENMNIVGVTIKKTNLLKLYRDEVSPIMRGLAYIQSDHSAYLWTMGFIPRLQTTTSLEVPNSLYVEITQGESDIKIVLADILKLTKLNYNSCLYGDGKPVTLKFADAVGEILTAAPLEELNNKPPLSFRYYI